jgi:phosphonate metabolism protein (transferase hexapeptide repeat family)
LQYIESFPPEAKTRHGNTKMLGEEPQIHATSTVVDSQLGSWTSIGPNSSLREVEFADYSYVAGHAQLVWSSVGKFCSIASHVRINPGNHPYWRVTQNHCTYRRRQYGFGDADDAELFAWRQADQCRIGHDVWIGHGATVLAGAEIGTGAVIGAGAVVSKARPIGPYEIAVGVPAKPVKKRFDDKSIEKLLRIEYWHWERSTLEERFDDLCDLDLFLEKYER